jgi:hypothetical protein
MIEDDDDDDDNNNNNKLHYNKTTCLSQIVYKTRPTSTHLYTTKNNLILNTFALIQRFLTASV